MLHMRGADIDVISNSLLSHTEGFSLDTFVFPCDSWMARGNLEVHC